jgi:hypothetical protein
MATLKQLNYNIRNQIRAGILSDDERIQQEQVDFIIHYVRALFIKQSLDKKQTIDPVIYQSVCIDLDLVDKSECPEIKTNCIILRSKLTIPNILRLNHGLGIIEVTAVDGSQSYPVISLSRARWSKYNKYTGSVKRVFFKNNYLYMLNDVYQEKLSLTAIYTNPVDANSQSCTPDMDEYPIPVDMIDGLTNYITRNILMLSLLVKSDEANDSNGSVLNSLRSLGKQNEQAGTQGQEQDS